MSRVPWYVARAAGLVAWTLLTASVFWGLSISTKVFRGKPRPDEPAAKVQRRRSIRGKAQSPSAGGVERSFRAGDFVPRGGDRTRTAISTESHT